MSIVDLLLGRKVANTEAEGAKLGILSGIPAMGLDGLSSAAYGPEALLVVLVAGGSGALPLIGPITWAILVLLFVLTSSYWQTIGAYPNNGGSYVVARKNLGEWAGVLAAGALMIDYTLNVAVGISAGVGALTSAAPSLGPYTLSLCLGILAFLALINLRGTREAGLLWSLPTYLFVASLAGLVLWGGWDVLASHGRPTPVIPPPQLTTQAGEGVGIWLILRAFASGCTAMTGVEAVSNGVGSFRKPAVANARATLVCIVTILAFLLFGVAELTRYYRLAGMDQTEPHYQSVLSQLLAAVSGRGAFYYVAIGSVLCVLCLSANTSFVGFPRLCRVVAEDGFLPRGFAVPGRRLVYTVGVLVLAAAAACLLAAFGGVSNRLIPLFAVGAFLSFSLSQAGMAVHWRRQSQPSHTRMAINGFGAIATSVALVIIVVAKFSAGAWVTLIAIPAVFLLLERVREFYRREDALLKDVAAKPAPFDKKKPIVIIPLARWDRVAAKAVHWGLRISDDVTALHVLRLEGPDCSDALSDLRRNWKRNVEEPARKAGLKPPRLRIVRSDYRSLAAPTLRAIELAQKNAAGRPIFVLLPVLVEGSWWMRMFHVHRERKLRRQLLRYGGRNLVVVGVPWQLERADPHEGIAEEEPKPSKGKPSDPQKKDPQAAPERA